MSADRGYVAVRLFGQHYSKGLAYAHRCLDPNRRTYVAVKPQKEVLPNGGRCLMRSVAQRSSDIKPLDDTFREA
jgi:hypothetical protein